MKSAVQQVELIPLGGQVEPVPPQGIVQMFDRFLSDPNASVEKIERLMALWERTEARKAEAEFNTAMSAAQRDMRPVAADSYNPSTKSRYASYEALDRALRPIYTANGFGLSFSTGDTPLDLHVRVQCLVTHTGGHSRPYHIDMPADGKGAKGGDVMTKTHATGSAVSYGMRYLLKMIFNVAVGEDDDDGNRAADDHPRTEVPAPKGYDEWKVDMGAAAADGWPRLAQAFSKSADAYRTRATGTDKQWWNDLKAKAERAWK
jgi:hypothetical protein